MAIRRLLALALLLAACTRHESPHASKKSNFFTSQSAWCTVQKANIAVDDNHKFDDIYSFDEDGTLRISSAATDESQQKVWDDKSRIKTIPTEFHPWHADSQNLFITIGNDEHRFSYQTVKRDVDGTTMTCFTLDKLDVVRCPCKISSEK